MLKLKSFSRFLCLLQVYSPESSTLYLESWTKLMMEHNEGDKGGTFPQALNNYGGAE